MMIPNSAFIQKKAMIQYYKCDSVIHEYQYFIQVRKNALLKVFVLMFEG